MKQNVSNINCGTTKHVDIRVKNIIYVRNNMFDEKNTGSCYYILLSDKQKQAKQNRKLKQVNIDHIN